MMYSDADLIHYENDVAACRARPTLYVGQTETVDCVSTMLQESMSMALQSAIDGVGTIIRIVQHQDGPVEIRDNGPTLDPTENRDGLPVVELLLTQFAACTDAQQINRSLYNFGIVSANALSKLFVFETTHNGQVWRQAFQCGVPFSPIQPVAKSTDRYRRIVFEPDDEILPNTRISYNGFQEWFDHNCGIIERRDITFHDEATDNT